MKVEAINIEKELNQYNIQKDQFNMII